MWLLQCNACELHYLSSVEVFLSWSHLLAGTKMFLDTYHVMMHDSSLCVMLCVLFVTVAVTCVSNVFELCLCVVFVQSKIGPLVLFVYHQCAVYWC